MLNQKFLSIQLPLIISRDVNTGFFGKPVFGYLKPVLNRISVLLTFIKMYYYIKKITICITCCNVNTLKAVSTPICSGFSLNEVMNIVYTVCFMTKPLLIKTEYIKHLPNSNHSVLSHAIIMILQIGPVERPATYHYRVHAIPRVIIGP